jgi:hypothetical protein
MSSTSTSTPITPPPQVSVYAPPSIDNQPYDTLGEQVSFFRLFDIWKFNLINKRINVMINDMCEQKRDSRIFKVPEYGSLEDAMKFSHHIQLTTRMYTRQSPFVIQITGNQKLYNELEENKLDELPEAPEFQTLRIYGDYVHIIGIKENEKKPVLTGTFKFVGSSAGACHLTIQNLDMRRGLGCKFQQATVTMINVNVQNSARHGVKVENGDITLQRCIFSGNGYWGLYVQGSVLASDCRFEGNCWGGVNLRSVDLNHKPTFSEFKKCVFQKNPYRFLETTVVLKYGLRVQGDVYLWQCYVDKLHADVYRLRQMLTTTIFQYESTIPEAFLDEDQTVRNPNLILSIDSLIKVCNKTEYNQAQTTETETTETKETKTETKETKETKLRL